MEIVRISTGLEHKRKREEERFKFDLMVSSCFSGFSGFRFGCILCNASCYLHFTDALWLIFEQAPPPMDQDDDFADSVSDPKPLTQDVDMVSELAR